MNGNQHRGTAPAAVSVRVDDMTCGHCVGAIRTAIEGAVPGAVVTTDLASHRVTVAGADLATVCALIAGAGYTPSADAA